MSFGFGLQNLVTSQVIGNQSIKTIEVTSQNSKIAKIDDITSQRISDIPSVETIGKAYYYPGSFKVSNSESDTVIYGIDKGYEDLTYLKVIAGELPSVSKSEYPVLLNLSALKSIGLAKNPKEIVGKTVSIIVPLSTINNKSGTYKQDFTVSGVIDSGSGAEAFLPSSIFRDLGIDNVTQLKVGVRDVANVADVRTQIESFGFETTSPVDTLDEINTIFRYFNFMLVGFGGIGMLIAILGMFNTLTISLLERTKEIGLMVALGARAIDMRMLFMFEAVLLSLFGATVGIVGAFFIGRLVNLLVNIFARRVS